MDTTEIIEKSLAWLYFTEQELTGNSWDLADHLNLPDASLLNPFIVLEVNRNGSLQESFHFSAKDSCITTVNIAGLQPAAPQEVYVLTQIILNTINTESSTFHDMAEIPGLESGEDNHLAVVARYLIKQYLLRQGWIEAKVSDNGLLIKLSLEGKLYLKINNAWA